MAYLGENKVLFSPQVQITAGADLSRTSSGRNATYDITTSGWKRVLNIIRGTSGFVEFCFGCNYPYRRVQQLGFDFSGYVKYPNQQDGKAGDNRDTKPVFIKRYQNEFGIAESYDNPQARVTKLRIAYPVNGTEYPLHDNPTLFLNNPINCYLDIYVEIDQTRMHEGRAKPEFNMNFAGFADSYKCEAITEETEATDTGMWGETLTFYEVNIDSMESVLTTESDYLHSGSDYLSSADVNKNGSHGLYIGEDGILRVKCASDSEVRAGTNTYKPITPNKMKLAVKTAMVKILSQSGGAPEESGDFVGQIGMYYNPSTDQDEIYIYGEMGWHCIYNGAGN